eukprot:scaffold56287_cov43-Tisochrysis_lutea.AAC.1
MCWAGGLVDAMSEAVTMVRPGSQLGRVAFSNTTPFSTGARFPSACVGDAAALVQCLCLSGVETMFVAAGSGWTCLHRWRTQRREMAYPTDLQSHCRERRSTAHCEHAVPVAAVAQLTAAERYCSAHVAPQSRHPLSPSRPPGAPSLRSQLLDSQLLEQAEASPSVPPSRDLSRASTKSR